MPESKKVTDTPTPSVARRAVNGVKAAPQKIVEHALNTAIDVVEKAAETDVKRTAKRAEKTAKKLAKVQKIAEAAESEAKRASQISTSLDKLSTPEKGVIASGAKVIKDKIKDIITPQKEVSFYYDCRQLIVLTALYVLIAVFVAMMWVSLHGVRMYNSEVLEAFADTTLMLSVIAVIGVVFVTAIPQRLAFINKDGIKIDHNEMLRWQDVEVAEEKYTSFLTHRPLIVLHLKDGAIKNYRLTFMQKICKHNVFTPFSIPMYAMKPEDAAEIRAIIKKHAKYQDNRN